MKKIFLTVSYLLVTILVGVTVVYAGNLTPPGPVANTMYSLTDIFNLSAGTTTTLGTGVIPTTPASIVATGKTLTEVYDAISAQLGILSAGKIAKNISAFGFTGALYGDVDASKVLTSATYAGTMADKTGLNVASTAQSQAGGVNYFTAAQGYYDGTAKVSATDAQIVALNSSLVTGNIKSGATIFGVAGSVSGGSSAGFLKTNQTICYDTAGSVVACAGTGQDGELLKGTARSYTDNNDGTITDNSTGLVWQKCSKGLSGTICETGSAVTATWADALTYCNANTATLPGSGWRLPNVYELYSLVDFGVASAPFINTNTTAFPATVSANYWSSTCRPANFTYAMLVNFNNGFTNGYTKTNILYVRCVRG
ncbi:MAG: DUF1566 domain-containing protein [Candidatus Nomurabacteria bacterium]|nr:DUF1566 domain-containing protein [Candidatus Nomurabacteria bacterium]